MTGSDRPDPTDRRRHRGAVGPVPVRDLMKPTPVAEPESGATEGETPWTGAEREFDGEDGAWIVRSAGSGAYGTGRTGRAMLVAVHFFRKDDPDTPVREALLPAGVFPQLAPEELRELFDRATPITVER